MTTDLLDTQKHTTGQYNSYANEAAHTEVKQAFMDILFEEHQIGHGLFCEMQNRGWYATEEAPEPKKCDCKAQFADCECGCTECLQG